MTRLTYRARWAAAVVVVATAPFLGACNLKTELLQPQQPSVISPGDVVGATGAEALRTGALGRLQRLTTGGDVNQENIWLLSGLLTDEWKSGDTYSQRNETDQRSVQTNNAQVQSEYTIMQQTRGAGRDAFRQIVQYEPDKPAYAAQMMFVVAFAEMQLGEDFCNGIPLGTVDNGAWTYSVPLADSAVFRIALAHLDSGLALDTGTDAFSVSVRNTLLVTKGRVLVDLGQTATAASVVGPVPTTFAFNETFSQTTQDNEIWQMTTSALRYVVGDSFDATGTIRNALPFASARDPRVSVSGASLDYSKKAFDAQTPLVLQTIWARDDAVPVVTGIDARLIEAEARLGAGDIPGMMAILNDGLRLKAQTLGIYKVPAMPALATPATQSAAVDLFFREKAFWTFGRGQRLGDLRRLVRQYGRTQDQIFPTGPFFKNGNYGSDVNFPVTDNEKSNPNFKGCTDRSA